MCSSDPELILVQAARRPPLGYAEGEHESPLAFATTDLLQAEERLSDLGLRTRIVVRVGPPARVILDTARRERVSLIAMSTHGRSGVARFFFGSVTEEVLRQSPVPLLVVASRGSAAEADPRRLEAPPIRTLLVPVDGSEGSLSILPHAASIAKLSGARIVLLQVFDTEARRRPHLPSDRTPDGFAFDRLHQVSQGLQAERLSTTALVEHGDPTRVILESCRLLGADMVAMVTPERSRIRRWMGASVTRSVLRQAVLPVLVARAWRALPEEQEGLRETVPCGHDVPAEALRTGP